MEDLCIIPEDNPIGASFRSAVKSQKMIFMAGLPGTSKSLLLQQLTILGYQAGRGVHSLQWDTSRAAFETDEWLGRFPEVDSVTHPAVRRAVGIWARAAVRDWHARHADDGDILVAELPVIGGRLAELMRPGDDASEAVLASAGVTMFVPIPTVEMREVITSIRARTSAVPRHEREARDAPISIVRAEWLFLRHVYNRWHGFEDCAGQDAEYDPTVYRAVFERLLRFRNAGFLDVDRTFSAPGSAYERPVPVTELHATAPEVAAAYAEVLRLYVGDQALDRATDGWWEY
ncbi:hypothetical protein [Mesorhizobium sp. Cs1299R1N3]|uniref:hypothetical protein n=1 Tax=Mesorhizobium sp. Cs1299R1N3 TaxID=3015173 RepID=UPI00301D61BC